MLRSGKDRKVDTFSGYFYLGTAILKFDSFSLLIHVVHTRIVKVAASFSRFALLELVCAKKGILAYTLFPTFLPQPCFPLERSRLTD